MSDSNIDPEYTKLESMVDELSNEQVDPSIELPLDVKRQVRKVVRGKCNFFDLDTDIDPSVAGQNFAVVSFVSRKAAAKFDDQLVEEDLDNLFSKYDMTEEDRTSFWGLIDKYSRCAMKIKRVCDTIDDAQRYAKRYAEMDNTFDIWIIELFKWGLIPPDPDNFDPTKQVYLNDDLNKLMTTYHENQEYAKLYFNERKRALQKGKTIGPALGASDVMSSLANDNSMANLMRRPNIEGVVGKETVDLSTGEITRL